jgi:hypothetical protein
LRFCRGLVFAAQNDRFDRAARTVVVQHRRDEHLGNVGRCGVELERRIGNRVLVRGLELQALAGIIEPQPLVRAGGRGRIALIDRERLLDAATCLLCERRLLTIGQSRKCIEDARAASAAHEALGDAQIRGRDDELQTALRTNGEHE